MVLTTESLITDIPEAPGGLPAGAGMEGMDGGMGGMGM